MVAIGTADGCDGATLVGGVAAVGGSDVGSARPHRHRWPPDAG